MQLNIKTKITHSIGPTSNEKSFYLKCLKLGTIEIVSLKDKALKK